MAESGGFSAVSNPFQVAMSSPDKMVSEHCPRITERHDPYVIHTQAGIDLFAKYQKCTEVPYLFISGHDINNLDALSHIKAINHCNYNKDNITYCDAVYIGPTADSKTGYSNDSLTSLNGLNHLESVKGDITISQNDKLRSIHAFDKVAKVDGSISLLYNPELRDVSMLSRKLKEVSGAIDIVGDPDVRSFSDSFTHLKTIGNNLHISSGRFPRFPRLEQIDGSLYLSASDSDDFSGLEFTNLEDVGFQIGIYNSKALTSLNGLQKINRLGDKFKTNIEKFIYFTDNPRLRDCSQLSQVYQAKQSERFSFDSKTPVSCKITLERTNPD